VSRWVDRAVVRARTGTWGLEDATKKNLDIHLFGLFGFRKYKLEFPE
jgi:hypothetical protein